LFIDSEHGVPVDARGRVAIHVGGTVVSGELRGGPVPDPGGDRTSEAVEVRRIVRPALRIVRGVLPCGGRALPDHTERGAVVLLVAGSELQIGPGVVVDLVVAIDLGPGLPVLDVDVLIAEYPAEGDRNPARGGRVVDGVAQVEARSTAETMQRVGRAV